MKSYLYRMTASEEYAKDLVSETFFACNKEVKLLETFYQGNKACVMLEFSTNTPVGSWIAMDYFQSENGKIKYSRTVYDPRKLAEFMQAQHQN